MTVYCFGSSFAGALTDGFELFVGGGFAVDVAAFAVGTVGAALVSVAVELGVWEGGYC